jgi:hypothetical protein
VFFQIIRAIQKSCRFATIRKIALAVSWFPLLSDHFARLPSVAAKMLSRISSTFFVCMPTAENTMGASFECEYLPAASKKKVKFGNWAS